MRIWPFLLVGSFVVMSGCSDEKAVKPAEKKTELQVKEKEQAEKEVAVEEKPVEVSLIDPNTNSILRTFMPEEFDFGKDTIVYEETVKKWARELASGTENRPGYDQKMVPDKMGPNGQIQKGNPRVVLDEAELVKRVLDASVTGGEVELPVTVTASGYAANDIAALDEVVVASYSTYFNSGDTGRSKNIELSAEALNNVIVGTGDIVSFNNTVGPREKERGYQPAPEALNGKLVMGIGGGVCQTSSTLFNAVDKVGVDYVEKHNHSVSIGYVPTGRDATVSYGGLDFRFMNKAGAPFLLKTKVDRGKLTVEVRTSEQYAGLIKKSL